MKKNLKIVSAAAAALLAVAPVAASAIPVGAANSTPISVTPGPSNPTNSSSTSLNLKLNVDNAYSLKGGEDVDNIQTRLSTDVGTARLGNNGKAYVILQDTYDKLTDKSQNNVANNAVTKFESGKTYVVVAYNVVVTGLGGEIAVPKGNFDKTAGTFSTTDPLVSDPFSISDSSIQGQPYYTDNKTKATTDSISIKLDHNNVGELLNKIEKSVSAHGGYRANTKVSSTDQDDLAIQLADKGISVDENNNFSAPANTFTVHYDTNFINGKVARLNVTVTPANSSLGTQRTVTKSTPTVTIDGNEITSTGNELKKGQKVTTYGTTSVNDTTYYRLDNGEFVEADAFKVVKPSKHTTKGNVRRLTLKKNAYIYNINHKRVGRTVYKKGSAHNVDANSKGARWHNLTDGTKAYRLTDGRYKNDYIDVRNFGVKVSTPNKTRRTKTTYKKARVRSRVFYSNGRAVRGYYIGKNTNIRVYGTKRIHGQNYYVIGKGRYVKTSNFR